MPKLNFIKMRKEVETRDTREREVKDALDGLVRNFFILWETLEKTENEKEYNYLVGLMEKRALLDLLVNWKAFLNGIDWTRVKWAEE